MTQVQPKKNNKEKSRFRRIFLQSLVFVLGTWLGRMSVEETPTLESTHVATAPPTPAITTDRLHVAWLMSFPNSGTSYTMSLAASTSKIATATNYAAETRGEHDAMFPGTPGGPWWLPNKRVTRPKSGYILTKTHCGGRCVRCKLLEDSPSPEIFLYTCLRYTWKNGEISFKNIYPTEWVQKAVHLIRDPVDNVVSRFHHAVQSLRESRYEISEQGFRSFCREQVDLESFQRGFVPPISLALWESFLRVPCHTDFFRYARWHENALGLTSLHDMDTKVLYYENYATRWNETVVELLDFLEQPLQEKQVTPFVKGKSYQHFFQKEELETIRRTLPRIMNPEAWSLISRYFDDKADQASTIS